MIMIIKIQFPDKLNNLVKTSENNYNIPKLDLSQVLSKSKKLENIKIIEKKIKNLIVVVMEK